MYITWENFNYFDGLFKSLHEPQKKRFLELLKISRSNGSGVNITKIQIIHTSMIEKKAIDSQEMITRAMVREAYMAVIKEAAS